MKICSLSAFLEADKNYTMKLHHTEDTLYPYCLNLYSENKLSGIILYFSQKEQLFKNLERILNELRGI